jgi:large subunit ribosomal protein L36
MRVASSIGQKKNRSKDCKIVRRGKRIYIINRKDPRYKVRQGG